MSTQLSKEQLFALFEEIKQEQATQFPLSERFLKQYFNSSLLAKAKEYLQNSQISFLEHSEDFSTIDSQVIGNFGNTFSQHIKITKVNNNPSLDAQCTCSNNAKCRHIAAVLLKLKVEHSGGFGEAFLVNDWFNELANLQHGESIDTDNVLLFTLEPIGQELLLYPKMSPYRPDGQYPLGRLLTEPQLNSPVAPPGLLESDFRLFSWVRSQNSPGHYELAGKWGFEAINQLLQTKRLFLQNSRTPLQLGHQANLALGWLQKKEKSQLVASIDGVENWHLIKTDPPLYLDSDTNTIGRINSALSAHELAHINTMPPVPNDQLIHVVRRFQEVFADNIVTMPNGAQSQVESSTVPVKLQLIESDTHFGFKLASSFKSDAKNTEISKVLKRSEQYLLGLGLRLEDGLFVLPQQDSAFIHWFNHELRGHLQSKGWLVDEISKTSPIISAKVSLLLKRDKHHHITGKVLLDSNPVLLDWDKHTALEVNTLANKFCYVEIAKQTYALEKRCYDKLMSLKKRFSYYASSAQFKFPLSVIKQLFAIEEIAIECKDSKLLDYLNELNNPEQTQIRPSNHNSDLFSLRDYQELGVNWLKFLHRHQLGGILADDMGLGKTLQVIAYFINQHNTLVTKPSLIVCPTSLVGNWQNEFARFAPNLHLTTVHGSQREKVLSHLHESRFILTTYPLLKRDLEHYKGLDFDSIVLDEAQYIKNEAAQVSKCVKLLSAQFKLCLSGTPVENNLLELKSLLDFVMPEILGTKQQFKSYFQQPIEKEQDQNRVSELKDLISPFILRRTKQQVATELPSKTELVKELQFSPVQSQLYSDIQKQLENKLLELFKEQGVERSKLAFLDALLKLRQICCHPKLVDKETAEVGAKLTWLGEHLPEILSQGRKVIIFSQFTSVLDLIAEHCNSLGITFSMLTGQTRHRDKVIASFTEGESNVFLISLKAGGTGLNLTQADTVIHFDPWWNPAVENQATDRAYRIGQDKPVFVYKLIMADSIEQKVFTMQQQKQALVDALFNDKHMTFNSFNEEQMLALLQN
ncbi:DEAD/DEAH box helicase [Pseudoalteromonas phenolica]|uniref:DNA helicase n=1 Tax=Pseudoalteromonas phenolica TaxID=161398 RepID=A0A0S2K5U7_9GAMM|nr:DEAD/DEAH box helicase [Pseudoalteromonas phenolica]ALO43866.1 DNA helicase [Pseudoalteromonas phenolica]MBE0356834.1 hypothetical protein [Pseudoalteromonas phenolica O-BC30]